MNLKATSRIWAIRNGKELPKKFKKYSYVYHDYIEADEMFHVEHSIKFIPIEGSIIAKIRKSPYPRG
jgi:hypothetical protein